MLTHKLFFRVVIFTIILTISLVFYAHWIEPVWIEVTHHTIKAPVRAPLRIAHLTDLHIKKLGYREKRLLHLINREAPDVILISGDSISNTGNYTEVGSFLKNLKAPLGVWLVRGNWEHWRPRIDELQTYADADIHFLNNANHRLKDDYWIIGLNDNSAGHPDLKLASKGLFHKAFKIGLFHSPDFFLAHAQAFNIVFAGHTHGGQVRLPFLPPLWLPAGSGPYVKGWYTTGRSTMYVSRGIGNSVIDIRFLCRPELPIIDIVPADSS